MKEKPKKVSTCFDLTLAHTLSLSNGIVLTGDLCLNNGTISLYCKGVQSPLDLYHSFAPGMHYSVDPASQELFKQHCLNTVGCFFERDRLYCSDGLTVELGKTGLSAYMIVDGKFIDQPMTPAQRALYSYHLYKSRKDRHSNPSGHFDNASRWYPDEGEKQDCCDSIRDPSRRYKYSLMVHCRTAGHIAQLCHVTEREARTGRAIPPAKENPYQIHTWIDQTDAIRYE